MPPNPKTLLVIGTHGQKNLGDDLLLESFLLGLQQQSKSPLRFIINSYDTEEIVSKYKDRFSVQSFQTLKEVYKIPLFILRSDAVLFAGGSILKELFKTTGRMASSSLLMILGVVGLARFLRRPVILSHIGASSLTHRFPRFVAGLVLRLASRISFRDQASFDLARSIYPRVTAKSTVVPDIVFVLPRLAVQTSSSRQGIGHGRKRIGLNLNAAIKDPTRWESFLSEVEAVLVALQTQFDIEVVGIPFQAGFEKDDDLTILKDFQQRMAARSIPMSLEIPTSFQEISKVLATIDVFLVERFHGVVLAALSETPFYALMYDPKVASLVAALGAEAFASDIYTTLDVGQIVQAVSTLVERPTTLSAEQAQMMTEAAHRSVIQLAEYVDAL